MRALPALCLLLAACGQGAVGGGNAAPDANQLARLSAPEEEHVDPQAPARPQPLTSADLESAGLAAPTCEFRREGDLLVAMNAADAVARIAGRIRHFTHSSPSGPTGGFFEDRQMSLSVGRTGEAGAGEGAAGSWPARLTVTNRRAEAQVEIAGVWRCF